MDTLQHGGEEGEEANVLVGRLSRLEEIQSIQLRRIGDHRHRPVAVLSRAVNSGEWFLMQKSLEAVPERYPSERRHHEHIVIDGEIGFLEVRRHLELAGRDFVVTSRNRDSEFVQLELGFGNTSLDTFRDSAEVVVLELLAARRRSANQSAAAHHQVRAHPEVRAIDEEVFLLGSKRREDSLYSSITKQLEQLDGLLRQHIRASEQWSHFIERFAVVADEYRGNAKRAGAC